MGEWILLVRMMSDLYKANRVYADLCDCARYPQVRYHYSLTSADHSENPSNA